jgi:hypothetical protein
MGRTLPSITQAFLQEQQSLARFRRALRLDDQRALDALLASSRHHLAAAAYASHLLPFEVMLLAMLVEQHKLVLQLQGQLQALQAARTGEDVEPSPLPEGEARGEGESFVSDAPPREVPPPPSPPPFKGRE